MVTLPWTIASSTVFLYFTVYVFLLSLIAFLMLSISKLFLHYFLQDNEKISEYECGFEPFDSVTRQPFDIHFYLVGLLFLIFDVELSLLFPCSLLVLSSTWLNLWYILIFVFFLVVGLVYEWRLGIIDWPN